MLKRESGFTLVELMVVTAIVAILASVAAPAYINYQNRARQTSAIEALLRAKMDQQAYWADNGTYAANIGCLYSFGNNCAVTSNTASRYTITFATSAGVPIARATRNISAGNVDVITINVTNETAMPVVQNPSALKFSLFSWIFN